jgi:hypothetical protein
VLLTPLNKLFEFLIEVTKNSDCFLIFILINK